MKTTEELKNLLYKNETVAAAAPNAIAAAQDFCEGYKTFLDNAKTEREATAYSEKLLTAVGYQKFVPGTSYAPGTKVYTITREKSNLAATIGTKSLEAGCHLNIAHIPILYLFVFALWIALCVLTFIGWRMRWGEKSEGAEK